MKAKLILTSVMSLFFVGAFAQSNDYKTRIGHGQDSIDVIEALQLYSDAYKVKNYKEAYEPWKTVLTKAPTARVDTYKKGQWMLQSLIQSDTDPTLKKQYFDDLMNLYDTRLKYMNELNSFSGPKDQSSKGGIICRKAYDSYFMNPNPDVTKSYALFKEGINDTGNDTEGFVLYGFIQLSNARFEYDKDKYREDFINDYLQVTDICGRLIQQANEYPTTVIPADPSSPDSTKWEEQVVLDPEAEKIIMAYQPPYDQAEQLFVSSGAADCDALDKIYRPKVEANKTDNNFLTGVLKVLRSFDCDKSDLYEIAADYSYQINKTPQAAIGKASKCLKSGDTNGALKYFQEAIDMEPDNAKKGKYCYAIAGLMYKRGNTSGCMQWINKTLQYTPSNGGAYLLKASIVARSGSRASIEATAPFCLAIDICNKAKAADPSCASRANKAIANYSTNLYPKSEAFMAGIKPGTPASTPYGSTTLRFR